MKDKRSNVLIIMTDEQPVQTVRCYGNDWVSTPNLDALAASGTRFTRAYTSSPVCTPARAGFFSGIYSHNTGAWGNHLALGQDIRTIGHHFQSQGYRTVYIGKWHLDGLDYFGTSVCPQEFEDEFWYDGRRHLDYLGPEKSHLWRSQTLDSVEALEGHGVDRDFTWGGQITNRALKFFDEVADDDRPWLLILSYDEPHHPWTCPPEFLEKFEQGELPHPPSFDTTFENKPFVQREWSEWLGLDEQRLKYNQRLTFAVTEFVDREIGMVLDKVEDIEHTYVLFTSDHGQQLGAHRLMWKGPWMYEQSIKVPFLLRGPGVKENHVEDRIISHIDVLPTLMELCGCEVPPILDGNSFAGIIREGIGTSDHPDQAMIEFNRFQLDRDDFGAFYPIRCIVKDTYKLVINLFDLDELYDLENDPMEEKNLIHESDYEEIRNQYHRELLDWMYVRRDAFRTPQWERRPWSTDRRFEFCKGKIRTTPFNGLAPQTRGYMTGQTIEYDFQL